MLTFTTLFLLFIRIYQSPFPHFSTADNPTARDQRFLVRLMTFTYLPVFNFLLLLLPQPLSFDWGMEAVPRITSLTDFRNISSIAFYSTLLVLIKKIVGRVKARCHCCHLDLLEHSVSCRNTNNNNLSHTTCICSQKSPSSKRLVLLSLALLAVPFLPATNLLFYVGFVVAERVLYIPSAGVCLLLGLGGAILYKKHRVGFTVGFAVMLLTFSAKTVLRNEDWNNEEALYKAAVNVNPPKGM